MLKISNISIQQTSIFCICCCWLIR